MTTPHKHRQTVIDRAISQGKTISDHDVSVSQTLKEVAIDFVRTYQGTNSFVQSIAIYLEDRGSLSLAQMRGALNVMVGEYKAEQRVRTALVAPKFTTAEYTQAQALYGAEGRSGIDRPAFYVDMAASKPQKSVYITETDPVLKQAAWEERNGKIVPNGTYTVPINNAGEYRVIKLQDAPEKFNKPAGTQIASYQSGSDNESDYTGFAFVNGDRYTLWRKFSRAHIIEHALVKLLSTGKHAEFGRLWAMEAGACFICGRKLTVPISKKAGIGPICAANVGIDIVALATLAGDKDQAIEQNELRDKIDRQAKAQADMDELFPQ